MQKLKEPEGQSRLTEAAEAAYQTQGNRFSMDEQKITAGLLVKLMSAISEESWCAGWMHNLEYTLWDAVTGRREGICSPDEIEQLKYLSEKCGGWIVWDEQAKGKRFIPMQDWLRLYEAKSPKISTEK